MVAEVADGVTRVAGSRTNLYVVAEGGSICLVDTGYPGDHAKIVAGLAAFGKSLADVEAVLLTHAHVDHIGSAERLRAEHGATVHTHVDEAPHAKGEYEQRITTGYMLSRMWWPKMAAFVLNAVRSGAAKVDHVAEVATFDGAQTPLDLPGRPVPVFTPGHTSGHCAYHFPDRGVLVSGDALVTEDSLTRETGPRLLHSSFNHDQAEAVRSLDRLRGLAADEILPGHGDPYRGTPAQAVEMALHHAG